MDAPQDDDELAPIRAALRQMDSLLELRWNPQSYVTEPGRYDAYGAPIAPSYDGRWEVVRLAADPPILVYQVRDEHDRYKPAGWWLVEYLQLWDRQNVHWMEEMARMEEESAREAADELTAAEEYLKEELDRLSFRLGGPHIHGRGLQQPRRPQPT